MDISDMATVQEERQREAAIAAARNKPVRNLEAEICEGCSYATKAAWGKTCDGWAECLQDLQRRERKQ
jgi:hypothetical protein